MLRRARRRGKTVHMPQQIKISRHFGGSTRQGGQFSTEPACHNCDLRLGRSATDGTRSVEFDEDVGASALLSAVQERVGWKAGNGIQERLMTVRYVRIPPTLTSLTSSKSPRGFALKSPRGASKRIRS